SNGGQPVQECVWIRSKARDQRSHQSPTSHPADVGAVIGRPGHSAKKKVVAREGDHTPETPSNESTRHGKLAEVIGCDQRARQSEDGPGRSCACSIRMPRNTSRLTMMAER